jgi:signal transduction histidine kinase/CheY-like chemotaxis protein
VTPFADTFPLLHSLGWLTVLMFAAVWPSLPGGVGRRHAGWLIGFGAGRLLVAAQSLVVALDPEWRQLAAVLGGLALWEFARRVWNDTGRRRISAATHLLAAECVALVAAVALGGGTASSGLFLPLDLIYTTLPGLLGTGAAWLLWHSLGDETDARRRAALRLAIVGLGLYGIPWETWHVLPPWIAATGLGIACFTLPATRAPAALACAAGLAVVAILGPLAVSVSQRQPDAAERTELLARIERAAAPLQGRFAAQLAADRIEPETRDLLRHYLEKLRATDPLVHTASLLRLRAGRVTSADLATGEFVDARAAIAEEAFGPARAEAFVIPGDLAAGHPVATACVPLSPGTFETPTAWLALEFPEVFWEMQRQHARHTGIALVGVLAAFCAMGFVLVVRQRLESAQQLHLERTQAADRAKTEFLAFLGHELRTPLQTILGRAELLRAQPGAERHAAAIDAQGRLLLRLVTDLLDLGTIEAGHFRLQSNPFSLRHALASVEDTVRSPAAAKHLALAIAVDPSVPDPLVGDEARLRQILGNLLGNAVKYTAQGDVMLRVTRDTSAPVSQSSTLNFQPGERLAFAVRDTGPGLPPEKIPQLFTLFTRLDSGDTFTREGTGVGLALVRRLCTLMGGTVAAANRPEGGAEFTVRLAFPLAEPSPQFSPAQPTATASHGLAIVLAEDNTATRELLTEALAALGHDVVAVADGPAALATTATRAFDVAVLDINLPGVDGVAVARQLRARHAAIRIVGCSAEALPAVRDAALAAGFDAFLVKPVSLDTLARAIAASPAAANLFDRLNSPEAAARTRALLTREWSRLRAETEAAVAAGDEAALRRLSHYLQSSALLLADTTLLELCRRLSAAPASAAAQIPRAPLDEIAQHFAAWPAQPTSPSSATIRLT